MWGLVVGGLIVWGGGRVVRIPKEVRGNRGVTISHFPYAVLPPPVLFYPFVSRLPPFIVFLPLSCKSHCLTSYSNREGVLWPSVRNKNCVVSRTTPHSPARSLKRHSFDTSLHHAAKSSVFCELQSYGASSQEGLPWTDFSPPPKNTETDQNGLGPASYPDVSLSMKMSAQRKAGRWSLA